MQGQRGEEDGGKEEEEDTAAEGGREAEEHLVGVAADVSAWAHLRDHHAARMQPETRRTP